MVNVDQDYIAQMQKGDSNKIVDLMPNIAGFTWGNAFINLNLEPTETIVNMQYVSGASNQFNPQICLLTSTQNALVVSLDHAR